MSGTNFFFFLFYTRFYFIFQFSGYRVIQNIYSMNIKTGNKLSFFFYFCWFSLIPCVFDYRKNDFMWIWWFKFNTNFGIFSSSSWRCFCSAMFIYAVILYIKYIDCQKLMSRNKHEYPTCIVSINKSYKDKTNFINSLSINIKT